MKAKGNGNPALCVANLLSITRGEVPYERLKGLPAEQIDRPSVLAAPVFTEEIGWLLRTYEPRVDVNGIDLKSVCASHGQFQITADIT